MSEFKIGVTGHRRLPADKLESVRDSVRDFYISVRERHPDAQITVLSSLAEGADSICAELALDMGFKLVAPLPMSATEYRRDFAGSAAAQFDCLLSLADEVYVAPAEETPPGQPGRGFFYRQAGIYVARHGDVLLAVWNGIERDTPDGAGTWETVKLAREFGRPVQRVLI